MKQHQYIGKEPNFQFIIIASFILHLIFIAVVTVPLKTKESEYKTYFVDLVGPADVREEKAPVTADSAKGKTGALKEPPLAITPRSKADMSLEAIERLAEKKVEKEKVTKEIDRIRAISSLSKLKNKKEEERAQGIDVIRQKIQGSASTGQDFPGAAQSIGGDVYYAIIIRKIKNQWVYPEADSADLEAIISFIMDESGKVVSYKIEQPSGNPLFDRSAVNAVLKASPLPPHPEENEIVVRFHR
ncbi:MAG: TonB C-terminal domain-containing protein [Nitrospirae bacterium]|nr:TonB C-terminal domain-containing protein [Nitrospirota bacterium]